jgi:hypothetical protein
MGIKNWRFLKHKVYLTTTPWSSFYNNLQTLYNRHNYELNHIWNSNENRIQVSTWVGARVLAKRGPHMVYKTIPKSHEWLIVNYVINVVGKFLPGFYNFKGERLRNNYMKFWKLGTCMAMHTKAWMISFLFKKFLSLFSMYVLSGIS